MPEPVLQTLEPKSAEQPGAYTWTFPGAPIRISIHLDVVRRLRTAAGRSSTNGRPVDIGGLLFGRSQSAMVEIIDYQLLPGGKGSHGYTLNEVELERSLAKIGASRETGAKSPVVGFFRTQRENSLMLRDEEIEAVHRHFNDPDQVILLIRVLPEQIAAGFLFWDGGVLTPFSFMEFPLDEELLRFEAADSSDSSSLGRVRPVEAVPQEGNPLRRKLVMACAAVVAFAGLSGFLTRHQWMPSPKPAAAVTAQKPPAPPRFPLQLDVEAQGKGLNIRWNSQSAPVAAAREGRLVIMETGQQPQIINLDPAQLSSGHVYYQSSAERLEFRLEVVRNDGTTDGESVLALSSKPAAPSNSPVAGREQSRQVRSIPIPEPDPSTEVTQTDKIVRQAPRQFTVPTRRTPEPARTIFLDAAPPETADSAIPRGIVQVGTLPALTVPPPPPTRTERAPNPPPPAPVVSSPPVAAPSTETRLAQTPAVPKWKISPTLEPALRAQIRKDVEISIRAEIDETGRVVKAEAITHQAGYLEASAISAMMKWRFEPAHLGNKAVRSEQLVNFVFRSQ
jgi:hypothetical protein